MSSASPLVAETPLAGYTIAVTADRRSEELAALIGRRGGRVIHAPAIRIVPLADDRDLAAATLACIEAPLDIVVATTGIGFRGWLEAADGWGLGERLRERIAGARILARGPKARGAIRANGLRDEWSPESEAMDELAAHLFGSDLQGLRIAVQLHGEPLSELLAVLRERGAEIIPVPVYAWSLPEDTRSLERLVAQIAEGRVDSVTFTSAPAVSSLLQCAERQGVGDQVIAQLRADVLPACVGPVCARPFLARDVPAVAPTRGRLGNLVRVLVEELGRREQVFAVNGRRLGLRACGVVLDGRVIAIPPTPLALLRALLDARGQVVSRADLGAAIGGPDTDEHVVEMAVSRLRALTGRPSLVETVVQRGYRVSTG
jgi:uroporphyrinogen-III synthase